MPDPDQNDFFHRLAGQGDDQSTSDSQPAPAPTSDSPPAPAPPPSDEPPSGGSIFHRLAGQGPTTPTPLQSGPGPSQPAPPNVTRGIADEDRIKSFGYDPKVITKSPFYQQMKKLTGSGFDWMLSGPQAAKEHGLPDDVVQGLGNVVMGIAQGGQHIQGALGLNKEDTPYTDLLAKIYNENYRQNILGGRQPTFWENRAQDFGAMLPTMGLGPEVEGGAKLLPSIVRGSATGAAIGASQPVYTDPNDPNSYAQQKATQTALGAAAGAGTTLVARGVTSALGRVISMFKTPLPKEAAEELAARLQQRMNGDWGNLSDVQSALGNPAVAGRASRTLRLIQAAGNDPTKIEQAALNLEDFRTALHSNGLYQTVGQMANKLGEVPLPETMKTLNGIIDDLSNEKSPNPELINYFKGVRDNLTPKPANPPTPPPTNIQAYMQWKAQQQTTIPAENYYDRMRALSDDLGDLYRGQSKGTNAMVTTRAARQLQMVQNSINQDLTNFTQNSGVPALQQASEAADNYYRNYRVPFMDRAVAKAGSTDEADTILNMFIQGGEHADRAEKFFGALGPKGRAAVQSQMMDKVIRDSTDDVSQNIDPRAFLGNLKRYDRPFGVFFQGPDQAALAGLQNLMRHAASIQNLPFGKVGVGAEVAGLLGHALGVPHAAEVGTTLGLSSQAVRGLLYTDAGKRILYSALSAQPLTPEMAQIFARARSFVPTVSRMGAAAATSPSQQPIVVHPWQPPPGFAGGGRMIEERIRKNTLDGLYPNTKR